MSEQHTPPAEPAVETTTAPAPEAGVSVSAPSEAAVAPPSADSAVAPNGAQGPSASETPPVAAQGEILGEPPASAEPLVPPEPVAQPEPLKYEPFVFGEGLNVADDDAHLAKFSEIAGGLQIPQEKAQELVNVYGEAAKKYATDLEQHLVQRQFDTFAETVHTWAEEAKSDPELGPRFDAVVHDARRAIDMFAGTAEQAAETREMLLSSGTGNHKAMIRPLYNAISRFERLEATLTAEGLAERPAVKRALADFRNPYREAQPGPRPTPTPAAQPLNPADRRYGTRGSNR